MAPAGRRVGQDAAAARALWCENEYRQPPRDSSRSSNWQICWHRNGGQAARAGTLGPPTCLRVRKAVQEEFGNDEGLQKVMSVMFGQSGKIGGTGRKYPSDISSRTTPLVLQMMKMRQGTAFFERLCFLNLPIQSVALNYVILHVAGPPRESYVLTGNRHDRLDQLRPYSNEKPCRDLLVKTFWPDWLSLTLRRTE